MPPRASVRRSARVTSREPADRPAPTHNTFQQPHLPALHGTPSSRRQYSYGAAVEPLVRTGIGLRQGGPVDLGIAVQDALDRQTKEQREEQKGPVQLPPRASRQRSRKVDADEDELASGGPSLRKRAALTSSKSPARSMRNTRTAGQSLTSQASENDDVRSFAMESDLFGDASIKSTPGETPERQPPQKASQSVVPRNPSGLSKTAELSPRHTNAPGKASLGRPSKTRRSARFQADPTYRQVEEEESEEDLEGRDLEIRENRAKRPQTDPTYRQGAEEESDEGSLQAVEARRAKRVQMDPAYRQRDQDESEEGFSGADPATRTKRSRRSQVDLSYRQGPEDGSDDDLQGSDLGRHRRRRTKPTANAAPGRILNQDVAGQSASETHNRAVAEDQSSDHSELDAAMQKDIEANEARRLTSSSASSRDSPRQRQQQSSQFRYYRPVPTSWLRRSEKDADQDDGEDDDDDEDFEQFSPRPPRDRRDPSVEALKRAGRTTVSAVSRIKRYIAEHARIFAVILTSCTLLAALAVGSFMDAEDTAVFPSDRGNRLRNTLAQVSGAIGSHIPHISWPNLSASDDLSALLEFDEDGRIDMTNILASVNQKLEALRKSGDMHESSLKKLESILPDYLYLSRQNGKLVVPQDFYHAMVDLMKEDERLMTFDSAYKPSSDKQWRSIVNRLATEPSITAKVNTSLASLESGLDNRIISTWDAWIKTNADNVARALEPSLKKVQTVDSIPDLERRLTAIVKDQLRTTDGQGSVVTRDEYLRHLKNEFTTHRSEIRAELNELRPHLEQFVQEGVNKLTRDAPNALGKAEIVDLVNGLVSKAVADANIEAMAKGKIYAHWDSALKNQVNYFGVGSGAIIDGKHSSATYDPKKKGLSPNDWMLKGIRGARPFPPMAAQLPWTDEGDCWCAARSINARGNPHGASLSVLLSRQVVPQQIVVEHILPGATMDPGARPRDIEVYAHISDPTIRNRVRDFSATHFPDDTSDWNYTPAELDDRFVKITKYVYEGAELHDGVHVHQLSPELLKLGATTDQLIVRATSNYGAEDHTCFYRVRLFGWSEGDEPSPQPREETGGWWRGW